MESRARNIFYGKFRSEAEYLILNVDELGIKGVVLASPPLAGLP